MSDISAARYAAGRLKRLAERQVKTLGPRLVQRQITPSEQRRRFEAGEELWRVRAGLVAPEQYERYAAQMQRRMMEE